jgi:hypothetical protein
LQRKNKQSVQKDGDGGANDGRAGNKPGRIVITAKSHKQYTHLGRDQKHRVPEQIVVDCQEKGQREIDCAQGIRVNAPAENNTVNKGKKAATAELYYALCPCPFHLSGLVITYYKASDVYKKNTAIPLKCRRYFTPLGRRS